MKTLVVGAGAAGLWAALHSAERGDDVTVVAPDPTVASSTSLAQGGIAAAVAEDDDPAKHADDTMVAGAGVCDPRAVRVLTEEAPSAIRELLDRGMVFDAGGAPTLEGGHSARRVLHSGGDATGWAILRTLLAAVRGDERIGWMDARVATIACEGGRVTGVITDAGAAVDAERVILATGGATGIYSRRTGPERAVGAGMALAWHAGATLADLEFVQFHPTALAVPGQPAKLLTEALRGEGALLVDGTGHRFMPDVDPRAELAPRDIVARAIAAVLRDGEGPVSLDARAVERVRDRFPTATKTCDDAGLDISRDVIPVAPAAHYFTGGVLTDTWGRTTVRGLSACGEVASSGVHGANRLASNSLLETLVFGRRAAVAEDAEAELTFDVHEGLGAPLPRSLPLEDVRAVADSKLAVVRDGAELAEAVALLERGSSDDATEEAATLVAWLLAQAALRREESRGGHFRTDFPLPRAEWRVRQAVSIRGWDKIGVP